MYYFIITVNLAQFNKGNTIYIIQERFLNNNKFLHKLRSNTKITLFKIQPRNVNYFEGNWVSNVESSPT